MWGLGFNLGARGGIWCQLGVCFGLIPLLALFGVSVKAEEGGAVLGRGEGRAGAGGAMAASTEWPQAGEGIVPLCSALLGSPCTAGDRFGSSAQEGHGQV